MTTTIESFILKLSEFSFDCIIRVYKELVTILLVYVNLFPRVLPLNSFVQTNIHLNTFSTILHTAVEVYCMKYISQHHCEIILHTKIFDYGLNYTTQVI